MTIARDVTITLSIQDNIRNVSGTRYNYLVGRSRGAKQVDNQRSMDIIMNMCLHSIQLLPSADATPGPSVMMLRSRKNVMLSHLQEYKSMHLKQHWYARL